MPLAVFPKCFLDVLVKDRTMSVDDWIALVGRELDVDGVEFYWGFTPQTSLERRRLRQVLLKHGLTAPMMCYSPDFTQRKPFRLRQEVARQKRAIVATAELGGQFCRVLSGQWKPGVARIDGLAMAADSICECVEFAASQGVCLVLENHYKDSSWEFPEFAQRMDDFLDLLRRIPPGPNFGVNYDPSNAIIAGDDPLVLLEAVKAQVVTMHASDRCLSGITVEDLRRLDHDPREGYAPCLKHGVIGCGSVDYGRIFEVLRSVNFTGWISIEDGVDPTDGVIHLRQSAEFLRRQMAAHGIS